MRNLLASPVYEEVTAISNDADLRRRVYRLAKLISDHEGDEIGRLCTKSLRHPSASIEARLQDTCKSHKEDGNVGFRNIHGCPSYLFSGLSGYIAWCLRKRFAALRAVHLVKSSQQIVEDIRGIRLPQGEQLHFVRLDVRDFFLSGSLGTIMSTIRASAWNSRRSQLVEEVLWLLVYEQFVSYNGDGCISHHRVVRGSGMGLRHSGELSDYLLYLLAEEPHAARATIQRDHKIIRFWRYRDDALAICSCRALASSFFICFS